MGWGWVGCDISKVCHDFVVCLCAASEVGWGGVGWGGFGALGSLVLLAPLASFALCWALALITVDSYKTSNFGTLGSLVPLAPLASLALCWALALIRVDSYKTSNFRDLGSLVPLGPLASLALCWALLFQRRPRAPLPALLGARTLATRRCPFAGGACGLFFPITEGKMLSKIHNLIFVGYTHTINL